MTMLYQGNQSAILLEKNDVRSSTGKTKCMWVCYYFMKEKVEKGDIKIKHCPTGMIVVDAFTKPSQEKLLRQFQSMIMNVPLETTDAEMGNPLANTIRTMEEIL